MNIVLVGYGRMGKEIEKAATAKGHTITARVDPVAGVGDYTELCDAAIKGADAVIEFALPINMDQNISFYAKHQLAVVIGTTGWENKREAYGKKLTEAGCKVVYGSNYSVGAHLLFKIAAYASKLVNSVDEYDMMIVEYHHKNKKDSPSGTALTLAEKVVESSNRKKRIVTQTLQRAIEPDELHIGSVRGGSIPGIHTLTLDSEMDTIDITHNARSRAGFAVGSVLAAQWVVKQKSGFYSVDQFINDLFQ